MTQPRSLVRDAPSAPGCQPLEQTQDPRTMRRAWCMVCLDPNPVRVKNGPHLQLQSHSVIRGDQRPRRWKDHLDPKQGFLELDHARKMIAASVPKHP